MIQLWDEDVWLRNTLDILWHMREAYDLVIWGSSLMLWHMVLVLYVIYALVHGTWLDTHDWCMVNIGSCTWFGDGIHVKGFFFSHVEYQQWWHVDDDMSVTMIVTVAMVIWCDRLIVIGWCDNGSDSDRFVIVTGWQVTSWCDSGSGSDNGSDSGNDLVVTI
jgi:hypothetical protein